MAKHKQQIISGVESNTGAYSPGIAVGELIFVSGQGTSEIIVPTIEEQTRSTLSNVRMVLEAAGCSMDDCVKLNAHLADIEHFDRYNAVYATFFKEPFPARTTVQSKLWGGILVEIDAIAVKDCGGLGSTRRRQSLTGGREKSRKRGRG